ncbi:MAG: hypothetical protein WC933_01625 [Candidatus Paceibacterota bacterium]|jgi:hypothetical protein
MPDSKKGKLEAEQEKELRTNYKKTKLYKMLFEAGRTASTHEQKVKAKEAIETFFVLFKEEELKKKK